MPRKVYAHHGRIHTTQQGPTLEERQQALRETTLDNIGRPDDLCRVDVRQTHDRNHFRVNVYRWFRNSPKMYESFYVEITPDGVVSSPPMQKVYFDAELDELSST